jgi:hypothetical protein
MVPNKQPGPKNRAWIEDVLRLRLRGDLATDFPLPGVHETEVVGQGANESEFPDNTIQRATI